MSKTKVTAPKRNKSIEDKGNDFYFRTYIVAKDLQNAFDHFVIRSNPEELSCFFVIGQDRNGNLKLAGVSYKEDGIKRSEKELLDKLENVLLELMDVKVDLYGEDKKIIDDNFEITLSKSIQKIIDKDPDDETDK